jgi:hypothetical protein
LIQLASCGTRLVDIGVPAGLAVSIGAIICGHVTFSRIKQAGLPGRRLALFGLVADYVSLLIIPLAGFGILLVVMGGGH